MLLMYYFLLQFFFLKTLKIQFNKILKHIQNIPCIYYGMSNPTNLIETNSVTQGLRTSNWVMDYMRKSNGF